MRNLGTNKSEDFARFKIKIQVVEDFLLSKALVQISYFYQLAHLKQYIWH